MFAQIKLIGAVAQIRIDGLLECSDGSRIAVQVAAVETTNLKQRADAVLDVRDATLQTTKG